MGISVYEYFEWQAIEGLEFCLDDLYIKTVQISTLSKLSNYYDNLTL